MIDIFRTLGILDFFALCAFWAFFILRFVRSIRSTSTETDMCAERKREKDFYKKILIALAINAASFLLAIGAFVGNYYMSNQNVPYYNLPIIILVVGGFVFCILLTAFFVIVARNNKIQNYNASRNELTPIQIFDKAIFGLCLFIGYLYAAVFANAIYMILLLVGIPV